MKQTGSTKSIVGFFVFLAFLEITYIYSREIIWEIIWCFKTCHYITDELKENNILHSNVCKASQKVKQGSGLIRITVGERSIGNKWDMYNTYNVYAYI